MRRESKSCPTKSNAQGSTKKGPVPGPLPWHPGAQVESLTTTIRKMWLCPRASRSVPKTIPLLGFEAKMTREKRPRWTESMHNCTGGATEPSRIWLQLGARSAHTVVASWLCRFVIYRERLWRVLRKDCCETRVLVNLGIDLEGDLILFILSSLVCRFPPNSVRSIKYYDVRRLESVTS